jgi:flagellar biosynthesis anti-sigma factor FlgM
MVINKIGNVNNIVEPKKTKPSSGTKETKKNDSIQISSEGKKAAEIAKDAQLINQASDVRSDKVNEIKEKIANGSYDFNDSKIIEMVADRIANFLLR